MSNDPSLPPSVPSSPMPPWAQPPELQRPQLRGAPAEPQREHEIRAALWNPLAMVDLVVAAPARLVANVDQRASIGLVALALLLGAATFAIPYGLVLGVDSWWRVAALYLGSTLICLPSLHVFSAFLGLRATFVQTTVLALTIPASSAVFTLGFAPILGFLRSTFDPASRQVSWRDVSSVLLVIALTCGVVQLWRCLYWWRSATVQWFLPFVWVAWHVVFAYVLLRMAHVLGLAG